MTVILTVVLVAVATLSPNHSDTQPSAIRWLLDGEAVRPVILFRNAPAPVRAALVDYLQGPVSDVGGPYNPSCTVDPTIPSARFLFGASGARYWLVAYEHGGRAPFQRFAVFQKLGRGRLTLSGSGSLPLEVKDLAGLVEAIRHDLVIFEPEQDSLSNYSLQPTVWRAACPRAGFISRLRAARG